MSQSVLRQAIPEASATGVVTSSRRISPSVLSSPRAFETLAALPAGVVVLNSAGHIEFANPIAVDLLGLPLLGVAWRDVLLRAFAPRNDDGHEVSLKDGRRLSVATSALESAGQVLLLKDLSQTRALQEAVARHERLAALGQMAAALAHQIRTPLASALLYASAMQESGKIVGSLQHLERLVNDMLWYARGGGGALEDILVTDLLQRVQDNVTPHLKQAQWEMRNAARDACIQGNGAALLGALLNVVTNALQACERAEILKPRIDMDVQWLNESQIEISVRDNGPGIAAEHMAHIFEPFYTTRRAGTGLGLAVVANIIQAHEGTVIANTLDTGGCEFIIRLPAVSQPE